MKMVGIEGLDDHQLQLELERGAKFVIYQYCISILIMTFKRNSNIYFVRVGESTAIKGIGFSFISLLLGWWGFSWGPIYTIGAFITNFGGGKDIIQEVCASLQQESAQEIAPMGS